MAASPRKNESPASHSQLRVARVAMLVAAWLLGVPVAQSADQLAQPALVASPQGPTVYPGVQEFRFTYYVADVSVAQREMLVNTPMPSSRPVRWDYEGLVVQSQRRKIGSYPEFSCKYFDFTISNECRTVWHDVYADLPVVVVRPQQVVVDVPTWRIEHQLVPLVYPRVKWKQVTLIISVPAVALYPSRPANWSQADDATRVAASDAMDTQSHTAEASPIVSAATTLGQHRQAMIDSISGARRSIDDAIATARAAGDDPANVVAEDGTRTDLYAIRASLQETQTRELARFDEARARLDASGAGAYVVRDAGH